METFILTYWSQLLFIGGFIWGYATLNSKVKENTKDIDTLKSKDKEIEGLKSLVERIDAKLTVLVPDYNGKQ